jgi:hypothetical protein
MTESSAKVVIKGDAKGAVDAAKQVGSELDKVAKKGQSVGDVFGRMGDGLAKAVLKTLALRAAVAGAYEEVRKLQTARADASGSAGKTVLDRDLAAAKLGISSSDASAITGAQGVKSKEDLTGFLGALASGDNAKFLDRSGVFKAAALFGSGLFGQDEVISAAGKGGIDQLLAESGTRAAGLSPEAAREMAIRREENILKQRTESALASQGGDGNRLAAARIAARNAENPGVGVLQGVLKTGTSLVGGDAIVDAFDTALNNQTDDLLRETARPAVIGTTR